MSRASSRAVPTRRASGTRSGCSGTTSPPSTSTTACAVPPRTPTPSTAQPPWMRGSFGWSRRRPRPRCASCATPQPSGLGLRATGHTASRSGRDGPLPDRLERFDAGDQGAPRGRRRAPAARRDPRGDDGVLRRARPAGAARRDESGHHARADPGRDPASAASPAPRAPRRICSLSATSGRASRVASRRRSSGLLASRAGTKAADLGDGIRAVREYGTLRLEGTVEWGPWTLEANRDGLEVRPRRPGDHLAGRRKKVQDLLVDAKVPRAERGRLAGGRLRRRSRRGAGDRRRARLGGSGHGQEETGRGEGRMSEVDHGVGEILIDEASVQESRQRARKRDLGRLRGPRPAPRRAC